jgi:hypothetical protein
MASVWVQYCTYRKDTTFMKTLVSPFIDVYRRCHASLVRLASYGTYLSVDTWVGTDVGIVACWTCCRSYCGPMPATHTSSPTAAILPWPTVWCGTSLNGIARDLRSPRTAGVLRCAHVRVDGPCVSDTSSQRLNRPSPVSSPCRCTCECRRARLGHA